MTDTKALQGKMRENSYTINTLARKLGLSKTGLFNKIHNRSEFLASEIQTLGDLLFLADRDINCIFFAHCVELKSTSECK